MTQHLPPERKRNRIARKGRRPRPLVVTTVPAPPVAQGQRVPEPRAFDEALVRFLVACAQEDLAAGTLEIVNGELRLRKAP